MLLLIAFSLLLACKPSWTIGSNAYEPPMVSVHFAVHPHPNSQLSVNNTRFEMRCNFSIQLPDDNDAWRSEVSFWRNELEIGVFRYTDAESSISAKYGIARNNRSPQPMIYYNTLRLFAGSNLFARTAPSRDEQSEYRVLLQRTNPRKQAMSQSECSSTSRFAEFWTCSVTLVQTNGYGRARFFSFPPIDLCEHFKNQ